ncbi:BamA/TamA family outer membrane protein [Cryomorphaceae bacterium]|nr:BamA/TamA family outer membrane protein [Cryomorphaceae bacterium]
MPRPKRYQRAVLWMSFILLTSCATYKTQIAKNVAPQSEPLEEVAYRMFLVGDAGYVGKDSSNPTLDLLERRLNQAGSESSVIFLGDNIYPKGLPGKSHDEAREKAEVALNRQLETLRNYEGLPFFVPGNHDWGRGLDAVQRQEKYVNKYINEEFKGVEDKKEYETYFYPENGCGGPEIVEINDQLVIVFVDSEWWLQDWDYEPEINDGCDAKSRKAFIFQFEEVLRKHRHKNVIIAAHHPIDSYGSHGGQYSAKTHLFPLTELNPNLWIPFPVIGSIAAYLRSTFGTREDLSSGYYRAYRNAVLAGAQKNGEFIFVSGHEHNLQYVNYEGQHQVVSGAGSKLEGTRLKGNAQFTASQPGFAELEIDRQGQVRLVFWSSSQPDTPLFSKQLKGPLELIPENAPETFEEYPIEEPTFTGPAVTYDLPKATPMRDFWMGEHYRDLYAKEYTFPRIDLDTAYGGMSVLKRGGGNQTNSLRLADAQNRQWSMRSLSKDATRLLPYPFNKTTAAEGLIIDNFLSTHPFGALAVPTLADAAQVYHTNPEIYYVPQQPAMGMYNRGFGGEVYLLEERPHKSWSELASIGSPEDAISTPDVVVETTEDHKKYIDQHWAVRSRLFDLVIGDWDRHDDQWRWVELEDSTGRKFYRPVPRDRDQAFSKYDGVVTGIARLFPSGFLHQLRPYSDEIADVRWAGWSARYFDRSFTNELEWSDWEQEATYIQTHLTDSIIDAAFAAWPAEAQDESVEEIKGHLRARRNNVVDIAQELYTYLASEIDVIGSDAKDRFDIIFESKDTVLVQVWDTNGDADQQRLLKQRRIYASETKEVHIYAMGDDDHFIVSGTPGKKIKFRLVGGLGEDRYVAPEVLKGRGDILVYDEKGGKDDIESKVYRDRRSVKRELNQYDRRAYHYEYDILFPLPLVAYNPDQGLVLGVNASWTRYTFKKSPFGQLHRLKASYGFATNSPEISYRGLFVEALGNSDFVLNALWRGDRFATNYFGLGNNTENTRNINYYRVNQSVFRLNPALQRRAADDRVRWDIGPTFWWVDTEEPEDGFISSDDTDLDPEVFEPKQFIGARTQLVYDGRDNFLYPTKGARLNVTAEWNANVINGNQTLNYGADLSLIFTLDAQKRLQYATRLGYAGVAGTYEFFLAPSLGENHGLRGYRFDRFRGENRFYHRNDLRLKLINSSNKTVPFSAGLFGGFDYGRVWLESESSDRWHAGYGGGLWMAPVDFFVITAGTFFSPEGSRFYVNFKYPL